MSDAVEPVRRRAAGAAVPLRRGLAVAVRRAGAGHGAVAQVGRVRRRGRHVDDAAAADGVAQQRRPARRRRRPPLLQRLQPGAGPRQHDHVGATPPPGEDVVHLHSFPFSSYP